MRAHLLDADGVIINTIEVESLDFMPGLVDAGNGGSIGDSIGNGVVVPKSIPALTPSEFNAPIKLALAELDMKSIRAIRAGETATLAKIEAEAVALRAMLMEEK